MKQEEEQGKKGGWAVRALGPWVLALTVLSAPAARADITVGGWAGFLTSFDTRPGTKPGFDVHPWYFYFAAEPVEDWKFFGELEAEHLFLFAAGKPGAGQLRIERLYVERNFETEHNLRVGKFFLPFGYWYRLHWHYLTETLSRPLSFNNEYAPRHQVGLQYFGKYYVGHVSLDYYAWLSDGPDIFGTDARTTRKPGYGASVFATYQLGGSEDFTVGAALGYHGQWVGAVGSEVHQQNLVGGVDAHLKYVDVRAEYYRHQLTSAGHTDTWYGAVTGWATSRIGFTYRIDGGTDEKSTKGATNHQSLGNSLGVIWRPNANVLLKTEYRFNRFSDATVAGFDQWNLFLAVKY